MIILLLAFLLAVYMIGSKDTFKYLWKNFEGVCIVGFILTGGLVGLVGYILLS